MHRPVDTMPLVNIPVRLSPGSRVKRRIRMPVSSLCITLPCAACRINSSSAGLISSAAAAMSSHCVAAGNGIPSCALQSFQPLEWHAGAVLQQGDHRHGRLVVLVRTRRFRFVGREDLPAGVAAQPLHLEYGCFQRRVPHEPHQRCRLFLAVHFSPAALRAKVAGMERGVRDGDPVGAAKRSGAIAPMTGRSRFAGEKCIA